MPGVSREAQIDRGLDGLHEESLQGLREEPSIADMLKHVKIRMGKRCGDRGGDLRAWKAPSFVRSNWRQRAKRTTKALLELRCDEKGQWRRNMF